MIITAIGSEVAEIGYKFKFLGESPECEQCPLKQVCLANLVKGRTYKVIGLRDKSHNCLINPDGVKIVEVEESEITTTIDSKLAVENMIISINSEPCPESSCPMYEKCNIQEKTLNIDKYRVTKIIGTINCRRKNKLKLVKLIRVIEETNQELI